MMIQFGNDYYDLFESDELLALANYHFDKQDYIIALPILKRLVMAEMAPVGTFSTLGRVYAVLGLFERAMVAFRTYLEIRPEAVAERFEISLLHRELGQDEDAVKIWDKLLQEKPDFAPVLYAKAQYAKEMNLEDEAIDLLTQLIEQCSDDEQYVDLANQTLAEISMSY
ncbi:tetratricopeptide repeat protein [Vibrio sp. MEBiC08052]|uniref:tetratricopeptide repeat protein n=1 Tax=Vibrio sp. MEBiC08052 TaxID=1761910 RepID=UPI00074085E7|nr:tetratricopeptide repeat protein [Vibrio sp. MEBiC08052]KUI97037.1 hypothetical protein VRK_38920 [Vibrio sp. MEBiC08052]